MAAVTVAIKTGKTAWTGVNYALPDDAVYVGDGGDEIELDDASAEYVELVGSCRVEVPSLIVPTGDFSADVTSGEAPLTVNFTSEMQAAGTFAWDFGDEGTSTDENPTHIYEDPGTYTVEVLVTATPSLEDTLFSKTNYITVT